MTNWRNYDSDEKKSEIDSDVSVNLALDSDSSILKPGPFFNCLLVQYVASLSRISYLSYLFPFIIPVPCLFVRLIIPREREMTRPKPGSYAADILGI